MPYLSTRQQRRFLLLLFHPAPQTGLFRLFKKTDSVPVFYEATEL